MTKKTTTKNPASKPKKVTSKGPARKKATKKKATKKTATKKKATKKPTKKAAKKKAAKKKPTKKVTKKATKKKATKKVTKKKATKKVAKKAVKKTAATKKSTRKKAVAKKAAANSRVGRRPERASAATAADKYETSSHATAEVRVAHDGRQSESQLSTLYVDETALDPRPVDHREEQATVLEDMMAWGVPDLSEPVTADQPDALDAPVAQEAAIGSRPGIFRRISGAVQSFFRGLFRSAP